MSNEEVAPLMTFTGPAGRTRWDENGALQTADENEIREDYCPRTGRYRGTRYEQAADQKLDNPASPINWTIRGSVSKASYTHPRLPQCSGVTISEAGSGSESMQGVYTFGSMAVNTDFHREVIVAKGTAKYAYVSNHNDWQNAGRVAVFDLDSLECTAGSEIKEAKAEAIGDGLIRLSFFANTSNGYRYFLHVGVCGGPELVDARRVPDGSAGTLHILFGQAVEGQQGSSPILQKVVRARDDGRFTDPTIFNNFERGTFVIEWETSGLGSGSNANEILSRDTANTSMFLYDRANGSVASYSRNAANASGSFEPRNLDDRPVHKWAVAWSGNTKTESLDGVVFDPISWHSWREGDLVIGKEGWSGWIRRIPFNADDLRGEQLQHLTAVPRRTTIASGTILGDYDPNERLSLFQDRHGIKPVERDGDPVRFILDLGPQGNHLQAAPESTGLIYRTDGQRSWIEYNGVNDYFVYRAGPILRGDISVSVHAATWLSSATGGYSTTFRVIVAQGRANSSSEELVLTRNSQTSEITFLVTRTSGHRSDVNIADERETWGSFRADLYSSDSLDIYRNGNIIREGASSDGGSFAKGSQFRIGYDGSLDRYWKGRLGRITLTADADQADREAIDAEIIDRYVSA